MEKKYYTASSLERSLDLFERKYRLSSREFYEMHVNDTPTVEDVPRFVRSLWASLYRDVCRMRGDDGLKGAVKRVLELA